MQKLKKFSDLTKEDIEYITLARARGKKAREIGAKFFVSGSIMQSWINRLGLPRKNNKAEIVKELYKNGVTKSKIERETGYSRSYINQIIRNEYNLPNKNHMPKQGKFVRNPNPPTATTIMLIHNYYKEDTGKRRMTHEKAIQDISITLGRETDYIEKILKGE